MRRIPCLGANFPKIKLWNPQQACSALEELCPYGTRVRVKEIQQNEFIFEFRPAEVDEPTVWLAIPFFGSVDLEDPLSARIFYPWEGHEVVPEMTIRWVSPS